MKTRSTTNPAARIRTPDLEEQIRVRAHEIYEQRGRDEGHDMDDWLQAEAELTGNSKAAAV
jgi:hypothetical protein